MVDNSRPTVRGVALSIGRGDDVVALGREGRTGAGRRRRAAPGPRPPTVTVVGLPVPVNCTVTLCDVHSPVSGEVILTVIVLSPVTIVTLAWGAECHGRLRQRLHAPALPGHRADRKALFGKSAEPQLIRASGSSS